MIMLILYLCGLIAGLHALLSKNNSHSALIWLAVCLMLPGVGALLYLIFGINRIKSVATQWESKGLWAVDSTSALSTASGEGLGFGEDNMRLMSLLNVTAEHVDAYRMLGGNLVKPLFDGTQAYPEMLAAIRGAQKSIYLCTYLFGTSGNGGVFIDELEKAHKRGVDVKVLIDGVGCMYSFPTAYRMLKRRKVPVELFLPPFRKWYYTLHINLRCHRKILTVDGQVGFTGGMNIHEDNCAAEPGVCPNISDLHFKVEGPIVGVLQDVCLKGWYFSRKKDEAPSVVYFDDAPKGTVLARGISSGPHRPYHQLHYMLMSAIQGAQKNIRIITPYLVMSSSLGAALNCASIRGVKVEIVLPEHNNLAFVKGACEAQMPSLLKAGIDVYYHRSTFIHTKMILIDDACVFIGSANLDIRSLYLNFEFNLQLMDKALAHDLYKHFSALQANAQKISMEWLQSRSFIIKLRNHIYKLFAPYL